MGVADGIGVGVVDGVLASLVEVDPEGEEVGFSGPTLQDVSKPAKNTKVPRSSIEYKRLGVRLIPNPTLLRSPFVVDNAYQVPLVSDGLEDQAQALPIHPPVVGIGAG